MKPGPREGFRWSKATVIYSFELWHRRHLQAPTAKEWCRAGHDHPSMATVRRVFGSWNAGVRASGLRARGRGEKRASTRDANVRWTHDSILVAISHWQAEHGRPPLLEEWRRGDGSHPSTTTVQRRFGSWNAAIEAAGFTPRPPGVTFTHWSSSRARCPVSGRWVAA
jgi:hypothetical protein